MPIRRAPLLQIRQISWQKQKVIMNIITNLTAHLTDSLLIVLYVPLMSD